MREQAPGMASVDDVVCLSRQALSSETDKMTRPGPLRSRLPAYEDSFGTSFRLGVLVPVYNERHVVETSVRRRCPRPR